MILGTQLMHLKLKKHLNWSPRYTFEDGIKKLLIGISNIKIGGKTYILVKG